MASKKDMRREDLSKRSSLEWTVRANLLMSYSCPLHGACNQGRFRRHYRYHMTYGLKALIGMHF